MVKTCDVDLLVKYRYYPTTYMLYALTDKNTSVNIPYTTNNFYTDRNTCFTGVVKNLLKISICYTLYSEFSTHEQNRKNAKNKVKATT